MNYTGKKKSKASRSTKDAKRVKKLGKKLVTKPRTRKNSNLA